MIETMKNITIVFPLKAKTEMLASLRRFGLLHIRELKKSCVTSDAIASRIHSLMSEMNAISDEAGKTAKMVVQETPEDFEDLSRKISAAISAIKALDEERLSLSAEISRISPWGDFDPESVKELAGQGYALKFYTLDEKSLKRLSSEEGIVYLSLKSIGKTRCIAVLNGELDTASGAREFALPSASLSSLQSRLAEVAESLKENHKTLQESAKYLDSYTLEIKRLEEKAMFERVKATSEDEEGAISLISGYLPEDRLDAFRSCARENKWAYLISDIGDEDNPPTLLKHKGFVRIIQPIYDILGTVPGYREYDISFYFLAFFAIFFAMIIGDGGYGFIFLLAGIVMNVKAKKCSDTNILLYVLSIFTIIWGALTGTWFGSERVLEVLPFLNVFRIDALSGNDNLMHFCFMLGACQLALACVINVIHKAKNKDLSLVGDIGWFIDICVLYMMALYLVIGAEVNFTIIVIGVAVGFVLVVAFGSQEPGQSFASGLKSGLGGFFTSFLDTVSCFSNIMSYIRLFAVGMASLAIAQSFNNMGGMAGPVFGFIIVALGTALNIVMGLLSVIVHGVRLNLLEFSGQLGMEWTGYKYEPFRQTAESK